MRNFKARYYIDLIENTRLPKLNFFMTKEIEIIKSIKNKTIKSFVDLGAGHGRVMPLLSNHFKQVYAIEINPDMVSELKHRAKLYNNVYAIEGDIIEIPKLLIEVSPENTVLGLLQNTLGTIEGDRKDVLKGIKAYSNNNSEIVISFFKASAMDKWGKNVLFPYIQSMIGDIVIEKTDLKNGNLHTTNGYTSKWWKENEIDDVINFLDKNVVYIYENDIFKIYHLN